MAQIYFGELHHLALTHIRELEAQQPEPHSTAWFLMSYLRRVAESANPPSSQHDVESSMRALLRFYVDVIETDSPLGERCRMVFESHRRCLRIKSKSGTE